MIEEINSKKENLKNEIIKIKSFKNSFKLPHLYVHCEKKKQETGVCGPVHKLKQLDQNFLRSFLCMYQRDYS